MFQAETNEKIQMRLFLSEKETAGPIRLREQLRETRWDSRGQKRERNRVPKLEIERAREELVALVSPPALAASSFVDHLSSLSQREKTLALLLLFHSFFSYQRESWRAGIEATREDVREEHCIIKRRERERA